MNWAYVISGVAAGVGLLMLVYHLTARRSDATIKLLEKQLEDAKAKAPDFLAKTTFFNRVEAT